MELNFSDLLYAFSFGLDCVESQIVPVEAGHGKRVAGLCILLGKFFDFSTRELTELGYLAAMHDNALTEYLYDEYSKKEIKVCSLSGQEMKRHCIIGEKNIESLPVQSTLKGAVLYHHEEADGRGPFGLKQDETPVTAQLIHMADVLDTEFYLGDIDEEKFTNIRSYLMDNRNIRFSESCVDTFLDKIDLSLLCRINSAESYLKSVNETGYIFSDEQIRKFCDLWMKIIDYKSEFTSRHSRGVSKLAEFMGKYYGFDQDKCTSLYFAGAVHDIGKLTTDSKILEKAGKLTDSEYEVIKNHAYQSWNMLKDVRGLEEITKWAVHHHEKLNGQGYPFGKQEKELGFEERLMACVDIYQALTEDRPYKKGLSHEETINIMRDMVASNFIDGKITEDMAKSLSI